MCGIFGITLEKRKPVGKLLTDALKHLEYRGYDSVGIAVTDGKKSFLRKGVGFVSDVALEKRFEELDGIAGIGHTRWATHGEVKEENAHPHQGCRDVLFVVHNGILENYLELRDFLIKRNHVFRSETDSEVIVHLVEEFGANEEGLKKVLSLLEGTYAFVVLTKDGTLLCARKGSPLVVGKFEEGVVVASDPIPILPYTKKILRLGEGEYCIAKGRKLLYRGSQQPKTVSWSERSAELGSFNHFMEKEIEEQPLVLKNLLAWLRDDSPDRILHGRIHLIGAGTSYHAALYGEYLLRKAGYDARAFIASEYTYWKGEDPDIVIAVSQSGETTDVLEALKDYEGEIIAITNNPLSSLASLSERVFLLNAGPELGVAATKTYTAQLTVLYYLTTGRIPENLPSLVYESLIRNKEAVKGVVEVLKDRSSVYYLGRGLNVVTAKEGALKIKEIAYIHAEAYPAGESKHGPIALVENGFPVVFVMPKDETYKDSLSNLEEMLARGAKGIVVGNEPPEQPVMFLSIPYTKDPRLNPIISVLPLQLLAYKLSVARGYNPDRPRNLAKSVTVK